MTCNFQQENSTLSMLTHSRCHKTIELHDKRYREIAAIIQNIQSLDGIDSFTAAFAGKFLGELALTFDNLDFAPRQEDEAEGIIAGMLSILIPTPRMAARSEKQSGMTNLAHSIITRRKRRSSSRKLILAKL